MAKRSRSGSAAPELGTVILNVGGRHFEVLRQTIEARPTTLLASLLDDIGTDIAQPVFVDANPERFAYILDWYRYGEIHLPDGFAVQAIINDARFFLLPDAVKINGSLHALQRPYEEDLHHAAVSTILKDWPTFDQYVTDLITEARTFFETVSQQAKTVGSLAHCGGAGFAEEALLRKEFALSSPVSSSPWRDNTNVCLRERLKVLVEELTKRGFECEVSGPPNGKNFPPVVLSVGVRRPGAGCVSGLPERGWQTVECKLATVLALRVGLASVRSVADKLITP